MTAVIIILCVVLVFVLLLFLPFSFRFKFVDEPDFLIKYAGITVYKGKSGENKKSGDNSDTEDSESFFERQYKKRGIKGSIEFIFGAAKDFFLEIKGYLKHLTFKIFLIDLHIATDNAADTAIEYGAVCAAAYPVLSLLSEYARFKLKKVDISADFDNTSYYLRADIDVHTPLVYALLILYKAAKKYTSLKGES